METEKLSPNFSMKLINIDGKLSDLKFHLYKFITTLTIGFLCILVPIFLYTFWIINIQINHLYSYPLRTEKIAVFSTNPFIIKTSAIALFMLLVIGIAISIYSISKIRRELNRLSI